MALAEARASSTAEPISESLAGVIEGLWVMVVCSGETNQ
jgi:hypothetical protein